MLALDLFGEDPEVLHFRDKLQILYSTMEKFFVIYDGDSYHMKVESEALPIAEFLEVLRKDQQAKNTKESKAQDFESMMLSNRIREIQEQKDSIIASGKGVRYKRIADVEGEMHEVEIIFMKKQRAKTEKSAGRHGHKKFSKYGKSLQEIA